MRLRAPRTSIVIAVVTVLAGVVGAGVDAASKPVGLSAHAAVAAALHDARAQVARLRTTLAAGTVTAALDALLVERGVAVSRIAQLGPAPQSLPEAFDDLRAAVADHDGGTAVVAARIAAQIDRVLPALRRYASIARAHTTSSDHGCDVVDLTPQLCVGGPGDNVYTTDEQLLVDLGGHNVFRNSAGGASAALPVSVVVSLGDDDTYDSTASIAQGAAAAAGDIGILVHVGAHASFRVHRLQPSAPMTVAAQGASAAAGGIGLLVDDSSAGASFDTSMSSVAAGGTVVAQGAGGALIELAQAPTTYRLAIDGAGPLGLVGQGAAAGVLTDAGGADLFSATAHQTQRPGNWSALVLTVQGDGGSLLEGTGDTQYAVHSSVLGASPPNGKLPITTHVAAQGVSDDAPGLLDDLGGHDSFVVDSSVSATNRLAPGNVDAQGVDHEVYAQGVGLTTDGLLADHGGATSYRVDARTTWTATPASGGKRSMVTASYEPAVLAQGVGFLGGAGMLADEAGPDTMSVRSSTQTHIGAGRPRQVIVMTPGASVAYAQGTAELGTGAFIAPGATDVTATFDNTATVAAGRGYDADAVLATPGRAPVVDGVLDETGPVHGTDAVGLFVAGASPARVRATPSPIACSGDVGFGTWTGCTSSDDTAVPFAGSVGSAPSTLGAASTVTFSASTPTVARRDAASDVGNVLGEYGRSTPAVGFAVSLTDGSGKALSGEPVRVVLEGKPDGSSPSCAASRESWIAWSPLWTTTVVTDRRGNASGHLTLYLTSEFGARMSASPLPMVSGAGCERYRLVAYYDGNPGRSAYPASVTHALVLRQ